MPHFQIDYSANLESIVDIGGLCECIRAKAVDIPAFPLAGVRVRAIRVDHHAMADGDPAHGFIDISIRLREGRTKEVKEAALQQIFDATHGFIAGPMKTHSIALSIEMRDINADLSRKTGTIRDHLETAS